MTRLFIRFYIGVTCVVVVALIVVSFDADLNRIKESVTSGGVRLAREMLDKTTDAGSVDVLTKLQAQFDYPIRIIAEDQVSTEVREWLSKGDDVIVHCDNKLSVLTPMRNGTNVFHFGPVELPYGPDKSEKFGLTAVLLLVAIAIAVLLRPLFRQLRVLEQTADAIAGGNLSARVDLQKADSAKTLARAFNDMATRVETLLRTQSELLQAVSHELRTPLARINFAIDLIRTAKDDRERDSRLESLDTAAQELDELVGELLQYIRHETGAAQPALESIELLPLVEELIEKESLVRETIQFEIGPELSRGNVRLVADRSGLTRVLSNLLANAGRFSRSRVIVNARTLPIGTTLDIDDDGTGVPESDRERMFEPFVRLEETGRGAGLGLSLVKRIVANHGGTVRALESPLGGCRICTFWSTTGGTHEQT